MRLIDADALIAKNNLAPRIAARGNAKPMISAVLSSVYFMVMGAPTIDAVEVVRCKDCRHYVFPEYGDFLGQCTDGHLAVSKMGEIYPEENYFCPYGERRADNA